MIRHPAIFLLLTTVLHSADQNPRLEFAFGVLAESRGIEWVEVDYDVLRGAREADLTLF